MIVEHDECWIVRAVKGQNPTSNKYVFINQLINDRVTPLNKIDLLRWNPNS